MRPAIMTAVATAAVVFGVAMLAVGCGNGDAVTGSGDLVTKDYDFKDFTRLDVDQDFEVEVTRGDAYQVQVTVDDNLVDSLDVALKGDTLHINLDGGPYEDTTQTATVTLPELAAVESSGSSEISVEGFSSSDDLELVLDGASSLELKGMRAGGASFDVSGASEVTGSAELGEVSMDVRGASTVELEGSGAAASLSAEGASHLRLEDFALASAKVKLSGASDATVAVAGALDIDLSGPSTLSYSGDPQLGTIETGGDSKIEHTQ
jgi:hypothetical protein